MVGRRAPSLPMLRLNLAPPLAAYTRLVSLELEPQVGLRATCVYWKFFARSPAPHPAVAP